MMSKIGQCLASISIENIKNVVITVAIIIGGYWAIFEFRILKHNININVDFNDHIEILPTDENGSFHVNVSYKISNEGNRDVELYYTGNKHKAVCVAQKVDIDNWTLSEKDNSISIITDIPKGTGRLRRGYSQNISCLYKMTSPGWYKIGFYIDIDYDEHKAWVEGKTKPNGPFRTRGTSKYIHLKK